MECILAIYTSAYHMCSLEFVRHCEEYRESKEKNYTIVICTLSLIGWQCVKMFDLDETKLVLTFLQSLKL